METRRLVNAAMPRCLVWAQVGLYLLAALAFVQGVLTGVFPVLAFLAGLVRLLAAYGIANEGKWGWWLGLLVCGIGLVPTLVDLVRDPTLAWHPEVLVLVGIPIAVFFCLLEPSSRDFQRTWFR